MAITDISIIDIKFYIVYCLFMVVFVEAKIKYKESMCNVERAPYYIAIQLQLRPIN